MTTITRFEQTTPPTRRNALNGSTAKVLMLSALCSAYIQGALTKLFDFEGAIQEMTHFGLTPAPFFAVVVIALELIASLRGETTVLFSTHVLADVERLLCFFTFIPLDEIARMYASGKLAQTVN